MKDLKLGVMYALQTRSTSDEREQALIKSLQLEIDKCRETLGAKWPPKKRLRKIAEEKPVQVKLTEPKATIEFNYINYELTRTEFTAPAELFDSKGVPIRNKFDCMISYQWAKQDLVRNLHMNLKMKNLSIWFDIYGNMQGNCRFFYEF